MLCNLRMGVQYEWEGVLIDDVPMEHIEFVVHHCVDGFKNEVHWKEMSGCINHQSSIFEGRLILYNQW